MAFDQRKFGILAGDVTLFSIWGYKSSVDGNNILKESYFKGLKAPVKVGDFVFISGANQFRAICTVSAVIPEDGIMLAIYKEPFGWPC